MGVAIEVNAKVWIKIRLTTGEEPIQTGSLLRCLESVRTRLFSNFSHLCFYQWEILLPPLVHLSAATIASDASIFSMNWQFSEGHLGPLTMSEWGISRWMPSYKSREHLLVWRSRFLPQKCKPIRRCSKHWQKNAMQCSTKTKKHVTQKSVGMMIHTSVKLEDAQPNPWIRGHLWGWPKNWKEKMRKRNLFEKRLRNCSPSTWSYWGDLGSHVLSMFKTTNSKGELFAVTLLDVYEWIAQLAFSPFCFLKRNAVACSDGGNMWCQVLKI